MEVAAVVRRWAPARLQRRRNGRPPGRPDDMPVPTLLMADMHSLGSPAGSVPVFGAACRCSLGRHAVARSLSCRARVARVLMPGPRGFFRHDGFAPVSTRNRRFAPKGVPTVAALLQLRNENTTSSKVFQRSFMAWRSVRMFEVAARRDLKHSPVSNTIWVPASERLCFSLSHDHTKNVRCESVGAIRRNSMRRNQRIACTFTGNASCRQTIQA